jgi:ubiquinone/menaquinone biosynthesis C-methylase UbiE
MQNTALRHTPIDTAGFAHPASNVRLLGIEPGMSVADFGAGSGAYIFPIAEALENSGHLYAIDVQRELLRRIHNEAAKRGFKNVKIIWTDLEQPKASKIKSGALDLVLVSNLLFQIENKSAVLAEAHRVLRPAGRLAIIDWSDSFNNMGPHKDHVVAKEAAMALAEQQGFGLVRDFPAGAHHWGIIVRKAARA